MDNLDDKFLDICTEPTEKLKYFSESGLVTSLLHFVNLKKLFGSDGTW